MRRPALALATIFLLPPLATAAPWLEKRGEGFIDWNQLTIQLTSESSAHTVAALGQDSAAHPSNFKRHELAAWQAGSKVLQNLAKELLLETEAAGVLDAKFKSPDAIKPYSKNTIYKSSGVVEVAFQFELRSLASAPSQAEKPEGDEKAIFLVDQSLKPKLAYDVCFEDGFRLQAKDIAPGAWQTRLGGRWVKGTIGDAVTPPRGVTPPQIEITGVGKDGCALAKGPQPAPEVQKAFHQGSVYWLAAK